MEWIQTLTPIISAIIGVVSYSALTNYRLEKLDKQVETLSQIAERIVRLEDRIMIIEKVVDKLSR